MGDGLMHLFRVLLLLLLLFATPLSLFGASNAIHAKTVGIGYEVWFPEIPGSQNFWRKRWGTPLLGTYSSADPKIIDQHAQWLSAMGVDFILVDWSNNISNDLAGNPSVSRTIIANTDVLFDEYKRLADIGKPHPQIAILMGVKDKGGFTCAQAVSSTAFADEVEHIYRYTESAAATYFSFKGKPLLVIYLGTPACASLPTWDDSRFTVRWQTGFLESQPRLYRNNPNTNRFWSWIDRNPIFSHSDGKTEAITVTSAAPGQRGWLELDSKIPVQRRSGARGVTTFAKQWKQAISQDPQVIFINQWNEFSGGTPAADQYTPELSNDIEPSIELGCAPMRTVQAAIASWKHVALPEFSGKCGAISPLHHPRN